MRHIILTLCLLTGSVLLAQNIKMYEFADGSKITIEKFDAAMEKAGLADSVYIVFKDSITIADTLFYQVEARKGIKPKPKPKFKIIDMSYEPKFLWDYVAAFGLNDTIKLDSVNNYYLNRKNIAFEFGQYSYEIFDSDSKSYFFNLNEAYTVYENGEIIIMYNSMFQTHILVKTISDSLLNVIKTSPAINAEPEEYIYPLNGDYDYCYKNGKNYILQKCEPGSENRAVIKAVSNTRWGKSFSFITSIERTARFHLLKRDIITTHHQFKMPTNITDDDIDISVPVIEK